jgi:hypothetical protein
MSAKYSQARKDAFLAALAESGNQTLAAERAKLARSSMLWHRAHDPQFHRACVEAIAAAKAKLGAHPERRPPSGWGFLDGAELVVRGAGGSGGGKRVQIARARLQQWSPRIEMRFLATLAATCNVKAACAEVGLSKSSAYGHRKRWRAFAERWDAAVEEGFVRIEAGLLQHGCNLFSGEVGDEADEWVPLGPMTVEQAIQVLQMHKHQVRGIGKPPGTRRRPPKPLDELAPGIMRKWNMLAAAEGVGEEVRAADEAEWARRRDPEADRG